MKHFIFSCVVAYLVTIFTVCLARPLAIRIGLVDAPTYRKLHRGNVPLIGGIAILFGLCIGLLTLDISLLHYRALLASMAILVFVGVLDDFRELSPRARFYAQILTACLIILVGKVVVYNLGNLLFLGPIHMGVVGILFSIIAVIGVINAINMIDGVDGLAGSVVFIQLVFLALLAFWANRQNDFMFILIVLSCVLGFLTFNLQLIKKDRLNVFMGDAGTMLLGVILAWFLMDLSQAPHQAAQPIVFLWIIALPLFDMVHVVYRRIQKGRSPVHADREHLHHRLQHYGLGPRTITLIFSVVSILFGLIGLATYFYHWSEPKMFVWFLISFGVYCLLFNLFYPIRRESK